jgi:hypothetical protein
MVPILRANVPRRNRHSCSAEYLAVISSGLQIRQPQLQSRKCPEQLPNHACLHDTRRIYLPGGVATFGNERRNQVYGPHFFYAELTLMKNFRIPKWEAAEFQIGAQAFNVLNHTSINR